MFVSECDFVIDGEEGSGEWALHSICSVVAAEESGGHADLDFAVTPELIFDNPQDDGIVAMNQNDTSANLAWIVFVSSFNRNSNLDVATVFVVETQRCLCRTMFCHEMFDDSFRG